LLPLCLISPIKYFGETSVVSDQHSNQKSNMLLTLRLF